eukprot:734370-Rhodomonas_salina.1
MGGVCFDQGMFPGHVADDVASPRCSQVQCCRLIERKKAQSVPARLSALLDPVRVDVIPVSHGPRPEAQWHH